MKKCTTLIFMFVIIASLVGCNEQIGDYVAASSISKAGFARDKKQMRKLDGTRIKIWGYVDHSNVYAHGGKGILEDWWSGDGPTPSTWRFDLKAKKGDGAGHSLSVHVSNDQGRDNLLGAFLEDARAGRPTKVFVGGKIFTFDAPTNLRRLVGLYLKVESTEAILLEHPDDKWTPPCQPVAPPSLA